MSNRMDYMGPLKNILLATDGSEYSEGAIKEAIYLAKSCIEKLSVIYVLEVNPSLRQKARKLWKEWKLPQRNIWTGYGRWLLRTTSNARLL